MFSTGLVVTYASLFVSCMGELAPHNNPDEIIFLCKKRDRLASSHLDSLTINVVLISKEERK